MKNYIRKRRIGCLYRILEDVSNLIMRDIFFNEKIKKIKRRIENYHLFNGNPRNFQYFLHMTNGQYEEDYLEIENLNNNAKTLEDCKIISQKCQILSEKLKVQVPKYIRGVYLDIGFGLYFTCLELFILIILIIVSIIIFYSNSIV